MRIDPDVSIANTIRPGPSTPTEGIISPRCTQRLENGYVRQSVRTRSYSHRRSSARQSTRRDVGPLVLVALLLDQLGVIVVRGRFRGNVDVGEVECGAVLAVEEGDQVRGRVQEGAVESLHECLGSVAVGYVDAKKRQARSPRSIERDRCVDRSKLLTPEVGSTSSRLVSNVASGELS